VIENTSLLICSRERPQLLLETVESVLRGDALPAEIVVVDQSAVAHSELAAWTQHDPPVRYIHSATSGLSVARNIGIAAAAHDDLVIIDDDMFVDHNWFSAIVSALLGAGPRAVVTARVLPDAAANAPGGFVPALATSEYPARYRGQLSRDVLAGGHMAARRQVFDEVGGFDARLGAGSRFPAADDNDLGFRLLKAGYEIVYAPEAVVYHRAWRPAREYLTMRWRYGRGKGGFYAKHVPTEPRYMLGRIARDIGRRALGFFGRLRSDTRGAAGDVVYSLGVLVGVVEWSLGLRKTK
jgi:GT2 family glycosyltransferase